jgi:SNF2 family DNA or RNA helicase
VDVYEQPNEFGIRLKTIVHCDGGCDDKCICGYYSERGIRIDTKLKPYQVPVIQWMITRENEPVHGIRGGINALEMGLGKSLCTLSLIMRDYVVKPYPVYPTLIVCPLAAIYTWKEQIELFFGESCPYLIIRKDVIGKSVIDKLTVEQLQKYKIVITNYETIRSVAKTFKLYENLFEYDKFGRRDYLNYPNLPNQNTKNIGLKTLFSIPWTRLVCDESHQFSNPKSALFYSMMCLHARCKWGLSGTPLRNYSNDLFSQFRIFGFARASAPRDFTINLYKETGLDRCILYMTKQDANIDLPELKINNIKIALQGDEKKIYEYFAKKTKEAYDGFVIGCVNFANVLTLFLRLRQCCLASYIITAESSRTFVKSKQNFEYTIAQEALNNMTNGLVEWISDNKGTAGIRSTKVMTAMDIIKNKVPVNEKVIVFTNFKRLIDVLVLAFKETMPYTAYETIDGDVTGEDRNMALHRFKKGDSKVLFISYKVGSESLNLVEATHTILMETVWCPSIIQQASARSHRVGQKKEVTVWQLVAEDTIEQRMIDICQKKQNLFDQFIGNKKVSNTRINASVLRKLLG